MINTEFYKVFYYVSLYKNISKAAESLFITQPAVSRSIKKLEEQTKCVLFNRTSKGVELTNEGEILFEYVEKAFSYLKSGERIIEKINNIEEGVVKIGVSNTLCRYYLLPCLQKFHKEYPNINIKIINRSSPRTYTMLEEGFIDFGIISEPVNTSKYNFIKVLSVHDIFVCGKDFDFKNSLNLNQLQEVPLLMLEKGYETRNYIDNFLMNNGITINPDIEMGSMDFLIDFAKIGLGVACVIKEFVSNELHNGELKEIVLNKKMASRNISIVIKENINISKAAVVFIEYLKKFQK